MKRSMIAAGVAAVFLAACAGTGFKWEQARQIKPGMTEAELVKLMGPPYLSKSTSEGLTYVWSHANMMAGDVRSLSVVLKDGKVVQAPTIPDTYR